MDSFEKYYNQLMTENQYIRASGRFNKKMHNDHTKALMGAVDAAIDNLQAQAPEAIQAEIERLQQRIRELHDAASEQRTDPDGVAGNVYNAKGELASGMTRLNQAYDTARQAAPQAVPEAALQYLTAARKLLMG